jgi:hypothetical protein
MALTGTSLANAFIVLRRKPAVLLLLFPVQAFAPFFLLLIPLLEESPNDDITAFMKLMLTFGALAVIFIVALARAVLLVPPAVELLHDGAAGAATPPGWFSRGIRRHWWKRLSIAAAEWSLTAAVNLIVQLILSFLMPLAAALMILPFAGDESAAELTAGVGFILLLAFCALGFVLFLFQFVVECFGAYLLPALADRGFAAAFRAVFGRLGAGRLAKLVGGRFLVGMAKCVALFVCMSAYILMIGFGSHAVAYSGFADLAILAVALSICLFVTSCLSVYRNAFEFCVFQEVAAEEKQRAGQTGG